MPLNLPPPPTNSPQVDPATGGISQVWSRWNSLLRAAVQTTFAPSGSRYILQVPDTNLTNAQALSLLASGFLKTTAGVGAITSQPNITSSDLSLTGVISGSYSVNGGVIFAVDPQGRLTNTANQVITTTGTLNRISVTNGASLAPTVDIDAAYVGQASITTLGTIGTGVWHGTKVSEIYGGTNQATYTLGDILYSSASNTLSKLSGNTTTTKKFLRQTGTGSVSNAPAWDTVVAADIPGSALTKTDDTNITVTLGGSPSTALLNATSLTLGWTGTLAVSRGGIGTGSAGIGAFNNITGYTASGATGTTSTNIVFSTSPTLVTPLLGTPTSGTLTNCTGYTDANLSTSDITTNNASTSKHGFVPKLVNDATKYFDSTGAYSVPAGAGSGFTVINVQRITTTGAGTYTPTANMKYVLVQAQAAGSGGGGAATAGATQFAIAAGGAGGEYIEAVFSAANIGASKGYSVGAKGAGGTAGNNVGAAGGNTTFNTTWIIATGGSASAGGGSAAGSQFFENPTAGGTGGSVATGTLLKQIAGGYSGIGYAIVAQGLGCSGGTSGSGYTGSPAYIISSTTNPGVAAAANSGAGGSGASTYNSGTQQAGGNGGDGWITFIEFI